jgi:hypothetical protein
LISQKRSGGKLWFGRLTSLWFASLGMGAIIAGLNVALWLTGGGHHSDAVVLLDRRNDSYRRRVNAIIEQAASSAMIGEAPKP